MRVPLLRIEYSEDDISFIKDEIDKVLRSGYLTMDKNVRAFEKEFADFCGVKYALGTNSGTSALEIALRAIDVAGGTVVMPSNTYMATPLAAIKAGASVIFTECEKENLQMDPRDLEDKIREDTQAVVIVHIGGIISPHMETIQRICGKKEIPLVEDAAHAHGALFKGKAAGQFGMAAAFSFYPTKVLTTAEGGMMVTNNLGIYKLGIVLREHGKADHNFNVHTEIGDNWRFSELHAVLGIQEMNRAADILKERRRLANIYDRLLEGIDSLKPVNVAKHILPSYYKYIVFLPEDLDRDDIKRRLREGFGVELPGEVYSDACHSQPVFKKYPEKCANRKTDEFPVTKYACKHHICLPLYPGLKDEEAQYVVDCLKKVV